MKKWLALVVAALLALSTMAAFAAIESPLAVAKIDPDTITTSTGVPIGDDFVVETPDFDENPEIVKPVVDALKEIADKDEPIITYFDDATKDAIADLLPLDVNIEDLELNELVNLVIENYDEAYGDIDITFYFDTEYKPEPDQYLVAVLGNYSADKVDEVEAEDGFEWTALEAKGQDDGGVRITFTGDSLKAAEAADYSLLGILSTPIPEQDK